MSTTPASPPPVIRLTDRQEAFCQAMACNTGGAEAARRAGYSASGAKQRGAFLMRQPEIRVRIDQLRAGRHADHQTLLADAAVQVEAIVIDALENKRCGLALRAIEFRLKLRGVIQDKRISHHYHLDSCHPDADLEHLDPDGEEEFDAFLGRKESMPPAKSLPRQQAHRQPKHLPKPGPAKIVTPDDDLSRQLQGFRVPAAA
jgi:phage terminase small subunit